MIAYFKGSRAAQSAASEHANDYRFVRDSFGRAVFFGSNAEVETYIAENMPGVK